MVNRFSTSKISAVSLIAMDRPKLIFASMTPEQLALVLKDTVL